MGVDGSGITGGVVVMNIDSGYGGGHGYGIVCVGVTTATYIAARE